MSIYSLLLLFTFWALTLVGAIEETGLRRGKVADTTQRELQSCPCSCDNPHTFGREVEFKAAQAGVLVQIAPVPGSPAEHTQVCLTQATVTPVIALFPYVVWCVAEPCPGTAN
jgi:hypothetical protein